MTDPKPTRTTRAFLQGLLSLLVPGFGQVVAGFYVRGIAVFASIFVMGALSVWTIAQEARFPDYALSLNIYLRLLLETALLLVFLIGLLRLLVRYGVKDPAVRAFKNVLLGILYVVAVFFSMQQLLSFAGTQEALSNVYTTTAVFSAAALAALWFWQIDDAMKLHGQKRKELPSSNMAILIACLLIFVLGYNITGINPAKAITEYTDVSIILPRIFWPWENAFAYDQEVVEVSQRIQAPCPDGATGPPSNEPDPSEAWVSATPTCGDLSVRDLSGGFTLGTELTITGGNFTPDQEVQILWKNPIGNPFTPRGVGETDIIIDQDGGFTTTLNIPDAIVPESTSVGEQLHTLVIRQSSEEVFSAHLSEEMDLALQAMLETIMMALMATFFGIILAFPLSFLAARNIMGPIKSPLARVVGGVIGLSLGIWLAVLVSQQFSAAVGGLTEAPIQIFAFSVTAVLLLGFVSMQLFGRLFGWVLLSLGPVLGKGLTALLLAAIAAIPGYVIGLGFSRGVRAIVLSPQVAAVNELTYAIAGAVLFALAAGAFGLLNSRLESLPIGTFIYTVTRTIMNIVRSIEPIIWAIVAAIWIGLGTFAGTIALTLHTIAALGKLYSESIESIDPGPLEALQATGANNLQTVIYAVIPQILPPFISFTIYRWDINVRLSTIIGLVGGGGIGFILIQWQRLSQWDNVGLAVWLIVITVSTLDFVSASIRERFV